MCAKSCTSTMKRGAGAATRLERRDAASGRETRAHDGVGQRLFGGIRCGRSDAASESPARPRRHTPRSSGRARYGALEKGQNIIRRVMHGAPLQALRFKHQVVYALASPSRPRCDLRRYHRQLASGSCRSPLATRRCATMTEPIPTPPCPGNTESAVKATKPTTSRPTPSSSIMVSSRDGTRPASGASGLTLFQPTSKRRRTMASQQRFITGSPPRLSSQRSQLTAVSATPTSSRATGSPTSQSKNVTVKPEFEQTLVENPNVFHEVRRQKPSSPPSRPEPRLENPSHSLHTNSSSAFQKLGQHGETETLPTPAESKTKTESALDGAASHQPLEKAHQHTSAPSTLKPASQTGTPIEARDGPPIEQKDKAPTTAFQPRSKEGTPQEAEPSQQSTKPNIFNSPHPSGGKLYQIPASFDDVFEPPTTNTTSKSTLPCRPNDLYQNNPKLEKSSPVSRKRVHTDSLLTPSKRPRTLLQKTSSTPAQALSPLTTTSHIAKPFVAQPNTRLQPNPFQKPPCPPPSANEKCPFPRPKPADSNAFTGSGDRESSPIIPRKPEPLPKLPSPPPLRRNSTTSSPLRSNVRPEPLLTRSPNVHSRPRQDSRSPIFRIPQRRFSSPRTPRRRSPPARVGTIDRSPSRRRSPSPLSLRKTFSRTDMPAPRLTGRSASPVRSPDWHHSSVIIRRSGRSRTPPSPGRRSNSPQQYRNRSRTPSPRCRSSRIPSHLRQYSRSPLHLEHVVRSPSPRFRRSGSPTYHVRGSPPPCRSRRSHSPAHWSRRSLSPSYRSRRSLSPPYRSRHSLSPANRSRRSLSPLYRSGHSLSPPNHSRRSLSPSSRGRRPLSPSSRGRRPLSPPNCSRRSPSPPNRGCRPLSPPNRSRRSLSPPNRSRRSLSPPNRSRRSLSPPNSSRRSLSPPYRNRRSPSPLRQRRSLPSFSHRARSRSPPPLQAEADSTAQVAKERKNSRPQPDEQRPAKLLCAVTKPGAAAGSQSRTPALGPSRRRYEPKPLPSWVGQEAHCTKSKPKEASLGKNSTEPSKAPPTPSNRHRVSRNGLKPNSYGLKVSSVPAQNLPLHLAPLKSVPSAHGLAEKVGLVGSGFPADLTPRPSALKGSSRPSLVPFDPFGPPLRASDKKKSHDNDIQEPLNNKKPQDNDIQEPLDNKNTQDNDIQKPLDKKGSQHTDIQKPSQMMTEKPNVDDVKAFNSPKEQKILDYLTDYGLHIIERDPSRFEVTWLGCKFCPLFGCSRRNKNYLMVFQRPFSAQTFARHLRNSHRRHWAAYEQAPREAKNKFFAGRTLPPDFLFSMRIAQLKQGNAKLGEKTSEQQRIQDLSHEVKTEQVNEYRKVADREAAENECRLAALEKSIPAVSKSKELVDGIDFTGQAETQRLDRGPANAFLPTACQVQNPRHNIDITRQTELGYSAREQDSPGYLGKDLRMMLFTRHALLAARRYHEPVQNLQHFPLFETERCSTDTDEVIFDEGDPELHAGRQYENFSSEELVTNVVHRLPRMKKIRHSFRALHRWLSMFRYGIFNYEEDLYNVVSEETLEHRQTQSQSIRDIVLFLKNRSHEGLEDHNDGAEDWAKHGENIDVSGVVLFYLLRGVCIGVITRFLKELSSSVETKLVAKNESLERLVHSIGDSIVVTSLRLTRSLTENQITAWGVALRTRVCAEIDGIEILLSMHLKEWRLLTTHIVSARRARGAADVASRILDGICEDWRIRVLGVASEVPASNQKAKKMERIFFEELQEIDGIDNNVLLVDSDLPIEARPVHAGVLVDMSADEFEILLEHHRTRLRHWFGDDMQLEKLKAQREILCSVYRKQLNKTSECQEGWPRSSKIRSLMNFAQVLSALWKQIYQHPSGCNEVVLNVCIGQERWSTWSKKRKAASPACL
ncbi:serine/arginine repetitive matrix protein 1 isoform X1 [Gracilaria domingensis]|nr:serine/arginine repetitive matrix protein 1 isoform X1 [Gracilaria domingensis]